MNGQTQYNEAVFHGNWTRCERMANIVVQCVPARASLAILEIGCGTGEQLVALARRYPNARLTGIDISGPNIAAARDLVLREGLSDCIELIQADYLNRPLERFDVIFSYSTLHLIPAPDEMLFSKLANELAPGGLFIDVIPFECIFNWMLFQVRRLFRACRGRFTDSLVLQAGALLARKKLNAEQLREKVIYMYLLPERVEGRGMREMLTKRYGFKLESEQVEPHASLAQPRHLLVVYSKNV